MMINVNKILGQTKKEISNLNDEYQKMVVENKVKSSSIKTSIHSKSKAFNECKQKRSKHFNFIRSK